MGRAKTKKKTGNNKTWKTILILVIGYVIYHFISLEVSYQQLSRQRDDLQADLASKKLYYDQLDATSGQAEMNEYIEHLAKKYLGLIRADEKIFVPQTDER